MNFFNFYFWGIVISFVAILYHRIVADKKSPGQSSKVSGAFLALCFTALFWSAFLKVQFSIGKWGYTFIKSKFEHSGHIIYVHSIIKPETFADNIGHDLSDINGMFAKKGFKFDEKEVTNPDDQRTFTEYQYTYYDANWKDGQDEDRKTLEFACVQTIYKGWIFYVIRDFSNYENFFNHVSQIKADTIHYGDYQNGLELMGDHLAFKYKNCVFIKHGLMPERKGYLISILKGDLLKPKSTIGNN